MRSRVDEAWHRAVSVTVKTLSVAVLAACAAAVLLGCGGGATKGRIGEPAGNTKVEVTVHAVKTLGEITMEDGRISTVAGNGVCVVIDMTVKNLSDTPHRVDLDNVHLVVGQKFWRADDDIAYDSEAPEDFKPLREGDLGPGKHMRGMVLVRVPQVTLDSLTYVAEPEDIVIGLDGMKATAPPARPVPRVGQTAKAGGLAMTVHSVTYPKQLIYGGTIYTPKSGDRIAVLDVTLKNLDRSPNYRIDPEALGILDAKGTTWHPYHRVDPGLAESVQLPMKLLKPGAQVSGKVVISVPANRKLKRIRYDVGVLGPPLEVRLAK